ncbi:uncharacterized protein LOC124887915 [Capsicum annuum]|uniref:uncharacterized protein LOC124887915 n=1 Tax=Capsicum annuum TaxID=4072 RepID=UPI001FB09BE7|nr:uncharacterized protein LOC124887915 [Capsicum annuum]
MELIPCQCLQVSCLNLEVLSICAANSITVLCSHQLPTAYFNKLEKLKSFLNLRKLWIISCQSMGEVITEEEQQGEEIMTNESLFPRLENLYLNDLPKLGHFILTKRAHEFPSLKEVDIRECPKMKTFIQQGTVSTLSFESVNNDDELKVVDLNKAMFNSKVGLVPLYN